MEKDLACEYLSLLTIDVFLTNYSISG